MNDSFSTVSFALDTNNTAYILYGLASNSSSIKIATIQNSGWKNLIVPLPSAAANFGNVAVDSKGYPHFIFTQPDQNKTDLLYASYNGSSWDTTVVASGVNLSGDGIMGQLVLDSKNFPHFCFTDSDGNLMYASYSGRTWNIQMAESSIDPVGQCYLALDANGNPHLSYRGPSPERFTATLKYATATEPTQTSSPTKQVTLDLPLLTIAAAVIIVAAVTAVFAVKNARRTRKATL